jgi:hypothetical protein
LLPALSSGVADRARTVLAAGPIEWPLPGDKKLLATMDNILASVAGGPDARSQLQSAFSEAHTSSGELSGDIGLAFAAVAVFAEQKDVALDARCGSISAHPPVLIRLCFEHRSSVRSGTNQGFTN